MNGKKAKALRKQARKETVNLPEKDYTVKRGNPKKTGSVVLSPKSTRGRYKQLKKEAKK
jgi:hypothetical protein